MDLLLERMQGKVEEVSEVTRGQEGDEEEDGQAPKRRCQG